MKKINNKQEFIDYFHTRYPKSLPTEYPEKYPCLSYIINYDGGIMGDYTEFKFLYHDIDLDVDSFMKGFELGLEVGWEKL